MRQSCFNLWMNGVVVCYAIVQFLAWSKLRLQGSTSWGASRAWRKMWARCEWWSLLLRASLILLKQRSLMFWCSSAFQDCWWLNGIAQPLDGPPRLLTSFVSRISLSRSPIHGTTSRLRGAKIGVSTMKSHGSTSYIEHASLTRTACPIDESTFCTAARLQANKTIFWSVCAGFARLEGDGMFCGDAIWLSSFTSRGRWQMSPPIPPIWRVELCWCRPEPSFRLLRFHRRHSCPPDSRLGSKRLRC